MSVARCALTARLVDTVADVARQGVFRWRRLGESEVVGRPNLVPRPGRQRSRVVLRQRRHDTSLRATSTGEIRASGLAARSAKKIWDATAVWGPFVRTSCVSSPPPYQGTEDGSIKTQRNDLQPGTTSGAGAAVIRWHWKNVNSTDATKRPGNSSTSSGTSTTVLRPAIGRQCVRPPRKLAATTIAACVIQATCPRDDDRLLLEGGWVPT